MYYIQDLKYNIFLFSPYNILGDFMDDFNFSSNTVYENLNILRETYPFLEIGSAGRSILGKNIPYVRIGRGEKEVFYSSAIHAK